MLPEIDCYARIFMDKNKSLPCIVNGHEPANEGAQTTVCRYCAITLHRSKLWAGMKWKIWWTAVGEKWTNEARQ